MKTARRSTIAAAGILFALLALTACGPNGGDPEPTTTPGADPSDTPTPSATPTPTDEPSTPPAEALTCQNIVPQSRLDFIAAQGWTLFEPADFFAKLRSEGFAYPELRFQDNGGIVCPWVSGDHVLYVYGYSPLPADQVEAASAQVLDGDPFVQSDFSGGRLFTGQMEESPFRLYWMDLNGSWYLATADDLLAELRSENP
jgi:hypothetical protein